MVSLKHVAALATSLLGTATGSSCTPKTTLETVTTTASWLTGVGAPSSSVDGNWLTGVPAPSSVDGTSLTGVAIPSSTLTDPWLGSSDTESVPEPSSTSPALGSGFTPVPMGSGFVPLSCFPNIQDGCTFYVSGFVNAEWMQDAYTDPEESSADCRRACSVTRGCTAFGYDSHGMCFIGTRPWEEAEFTPDDGPGAKQWAQADCFNCYDYSVLALDFEDNNVDDWTMDLADMDLPWFWDSPHVGGNRGQALRIGEPQGIDGRGAGARLNYGITFPLEVGKTYSFGYKMRVERNNYLIKNYDAITFMISTNDEIIFEFTPKRSDANPLEGIEEFTLHGGEEGDATLSIFVNGSGHGYDYYFDHLYVTWGI